MKDLYQSLKARIELKAPSIQQVGFYNRQFEETNHENAEQNTQQAIFYPNVFIEFPEDNEQVAAGMGAKRIRVMIRFWIGLTSYNLEPLEMFDIVNEVQLGVENFQDTMMSPLTYKARRVCHDFNNVIVWQYDYETIYSDNLKYLYSTNIQQVTGVKIVPEPIIEPNL
jgi:hypothetical protein